MDNSDSDGEIQVNTESFMSSLSSSYAQSIIPQYILGQDLNAFKQEFNCKICGAKVKDTLIRGKSKRYSCKFCHHAVCANCSNLRCMQTARGEILRICIDCFNKAIRDKFIDELKEDKERMLSIIKTEKESNETAINNLKKLIIKKRAKIERIKADLYSCNKRTIELNDWQYIDNNYTLEVLNDAKTRLGRRLKRHDKIKKKILENQHYLNTLQNEKVNNELNQSNLQADLASFDIRRMSLKMKDEKSLEILKSQIISHNGVVSTLKQDIETIQSRIAEALKGQDDCVIQ
ncbi:hypothetical protein SteCoe_14852 [Stentor coeruleus]|uniref:FYVE-type domain-containing protein n=1 Tax=Stentor coeruleus TaxID=5963 RepID=A0A1R2C543_9CILI|nr:hypothetical protein SteCoe_14852 [Stentor coeruleus]